MSTSPESEFDLELLFLPAWAQESPAVNRYAKFEGGDAGDRSPRRSDRSDPRARRGPPDRRPEGPRRSGPPDRFQGRPPGQGPPRPRREDRPPDRPGGYRREDRREAPPSLPDVDVTFLPEEKGVDLLARQIKLTGRAYPLFGIGLMILKKPERHQVSLAVVKNPDGQAVQPLFLCALDDTIWLSEQETIHHVFKRHFATFYQAERTAIEPPKGTYTFVAQCGMSGVILGPPNYHDYQSKLLKLHADRFARVPFDVFKSRVKIVRDEAVVKQWVEDQSWRTEYACLNVPEPKRLTSLDQAEAHFREVHLANVIKPVDTFTLNGPSSRRLPNPTLIAIIRRALDDQLRFPLRISTLLSQQFAARGLQFFKVNKTITHVSVARPHYLDLAATPVSDGVRRIVEFINATPGCTRRKLIEALAPSASPPLSTPVALPAKASAPDAVAATPPAETGAPAEAVAAAPPDQPEPSPEATALIGDLHWLIHQGHVIEFANGTLETAKQPAPRPPKPSPAPTQPSEAPPSAPAMESLASVAADPGTSLTAENIFSTEATSESAAPVETAPNPAPELNPLAP